MQGTGSSPLTPVVRGPDARVSGTKTVVAWRIHQVDNRNPYHGTMRTLKP